MQGVLVAQLFRLQRPKNNVDRLSFHEVGIPLAVACHFVALIVTLIGSFRFWRQQNAIARGKIYAGGWELNSVGIFLFIVSPSSHDLGYDKQANWSLATSDRYHDFGSVGHYPHTNRYESSRICCSNIALVITLHSEAFHSGRIDHPYSAFAPLTVHNPPQANWVMFFFFFFFSRSSQLLTNAFIKRLSCIQTPSGCAQCTI